MRVLFILIVALLAFPDAAAQVDPYETTIQRESETFVPCEIFDEDERLLCERLRAARDQLRTVMLTTFERKEGRHAVSYREFVLVAYDPTDDRLHEIRLAMPKDTSKQRDFQPIVLTESDPPYEVKRLRGQSLNKMVFEIRQGGHELYAYAGKHLLFTYEKLHPLWGGRTVELREAVIYLATAPYLVNQAFARAGQDLFMTAIERAFDELRESRQESLAYPGQLLADTVTPSEIAHLLVTEQTDPCFLVSRPSGCDRLIPVRPYPNDETVMQAVNTEFVVNGLAAFRYMRSLADARGVLQFTDNPSKRYAGTYSLVVDRCPRAAIDPDFRRGTKSLANLTKAAACLIDLELSSRGLPDWVREAFLTDREFALLVLGAAYNGGATQAQRLSRFIDEFAKRRAIDRKDFLFGTFPWEQFLDWLDRTKRSLKPETRGYIEKIIKVREHLHRHRPRPSIFNFRRALA